MKITLQEKERIEKFMTAAKYSIALHNCEHFANYVLYGLNLSSQHNLWWKSLGANVIYYLQPTQSTKENCQNYMRQQIADILNDNLRKAKIEKANRKHLEFWSARGVRFKQDD
ncbi:conserved hypothetical protein [Hyella patelloides LEGE 07179]|uniref:LRAT domain-containing protein n=1 Tax=Hyella patelloides LEGE 07179 TaxID=945734 RepID=A0A563W432_9CYAN|nr:hypothetical protein [Hyella patelloides]VEP18452.1 conserved hypothetical protein [Hyella patelloides LEGE 07179]